MVAYPGEWEAMKERVAVVEFGDIRLAREIIFGGKEIQNATESA